MSQENGNKDLPSLLEKFKAKPEELVNALAECSGSITTLMTSLNPRDTRTAEYIMSSIIAILDRPENKEHKAQWDRMMQINREAKILTAQNKALDFIARYNPPEDSTLAAVTAYTKLWMMAERLANNSTDIVISEAVEAEAIALEMQQNINGRR